jgi:RNA polymerase sigma factor (sigma-70 family)
MDLVAGAAPVAPDVARTETFEAFYRAQADRVYRALALTLGNDDVAREATDEAMTRAYARWTRIGVLDNPAAWVYRVGLNWATSVWRKTRRERAHSDADRHPSTAPPDPAALAARAALHALPRTQRAVVVCRIFLELSTAETAAILGTTEGTVKSRLARGLAGLRATLTDRETP